MNELIVAVGLVFVLEGLLYALFPAQLKGMLLRMQEMPEGSLRVGGAVFVAFGVLIVWLIRG
ncbi:DUF2065 domain-containing protein [Polycladidibacter hongkongensis]|uniref:DUF2065 domain-containing protein n=1 Tax=Polycladidibacter hongkongensis TaxID=1647556 RepID=UPI00082AB0C3|nr:DUF2065 domain-containing protein [Pseudovibrio hongkongensis]